jgi:glutamyl-tRNA synthetase
MVRTRIAPSPTGIPHIGTTRTALFNYLYTKRNKGAFILRIEDTDRARLVPESLTAIKEILTWLDIQWDEEYIQSERLDIYKEHANQLVEKDLAYQDNGAIRFRMPKEGKSEWTDVVGNRHISFENKDQEDFIILKSDGYPTYNFAHVIDDHLMKISHVLRGEEFISSTPKHLQIYKAFEWEVPVLCHLPVVLGNDHQKLSKRHGAKSALDYKKDGYVKEAINNFMALLGWNPGGDKELLSMEEMIQLFDITDINVANPIFDAQKLDWMNGTYIRQYQVSSIKNQVYELNPELKELDDQLIDKLLELAQTRMKKLTEFSEMVKPLIGKPSYELTSQQKTIAKELADSFSELPEWNKDTIFAAIKTSMEKHSIKMPVFYKILTGSEHGLPLPQTLEILGKDWTLKRLSEVI